MKIDGSRKSTIYCDYKGTYEEKYLSGDIYPEDAETYQVPVYSVSGDTSYLKGYEKKVFEDPIRVQCLKQDENKGTIMFEDVSIPIWMEEDGDKKTKEKKVSAYRGAATMREYYETVNEVETAIFRPVKLFVGTENHSVSLYECVVHGSFSMEVEKDDQNMLKVDVKRKDEYSDNLCTISFAIDLEKGEVIFPD